MSKGAKVLLWYWRYHALDMGMRDSIGSAAYSACHMEDDAQGVPVAIEVYDEGARRVIVGDELKQVIEAERRRYDREMAAARAARKREWSVWVGSPDEVEGSTAWTECDYGTREQAEATAEELAYLGDGRVRVERYGVQP